MTEPDGGIVWLASYPKSGNTWIRMFLACYKNDGMPVNFSAVPRELTYADYRSSDYHMIAPYPIEHLGLTDTLFLRGAVLIKLLTDSPIKPTIVKTHNANAVLEGVSLIPRPLTNKAVYIVRDPRDVVLSYSKYGEKTVDDIIDTMSNESSIVPNYDSKSNKIFSFIGNWSKHVKSWMDSEFDVLVVKYERMHEEPVRVFSELIKYIGLDLNDSMVVKSVESSSFGKLQKFEEAHGFLEKPDGVDKFFRSGKVGEWKDFLTKEQSDRIVSDHGEVMKTLGYL